MEFILFWFVLAIVVGVIASNRDRSGFGWFLLSLFLSPLIGLILVLALGRPASDPSKDGQHKKCPACAEWIKREATKCKHCGETLTLAASAVRGSVDSGVVRPSPESEAFGRSLGAFVARNRIAVGTVVAVLVLWALFRHFAGT